MGRIKRLILGAVLGAIALTLTGCDLTWEQIDAVLNRPREAITEVCERNVTLLNAYRNIGLLSDTQAAAMVTALEEYRDEIIKGDPNNFINRIDPSVVAVASSIEDLENAMSKYGYTHFSDRDEDTTECVFAKYVGSGDIKFASHGSDAVGLSFAPDNFASTLIDRINKNIWVLNPSLSSSDFSTAVLASMNAADNPTDENAIRVLTNATKPYFVNSGQKLTTYDADDIFEDSSDNVDIGAPDSSVKNAINKDICLTAPVTWEYTDVDDKGVEHTYTYGADVVVLIIRVSEISKEFQESINLSAQTQDKYVLPDVENASSDFNEKIFLMEYPVSIMSNLQLGTKDSRSSTLGSSDYAITFVQEPKLKVNIASGEMVWDGNVVNKETEESERIYRVDTNPSFTFYENGGSETDVQLNTATYDITIGTDTDGNDNLYTGDVISAADVDLSLISLDESGHWIYTPDRTSYYCTKPYDTTLAATIALIDYLELTYLPGVISGEPFIATGRRVRLEETQLEGSTADEDTRIAYFTDKLGNAISTDGNATVIKIGDVIDRTSGNNYYEEVAEKLGIGGLKNTDEVQAELDLDPNSRSTDTLVEIINDGSASDIGDDGLIDDTHQLPYSAYFTYLDPIMKFGTEKDGDIPALAACDVDTENTYAFWGLCVDVNAFDTHLYTNWIEVSGDGGDVGSLNWWNTWLSSHGFNYHIDIDDLEDAISNVYRNSLTDKDDTVILDLNVINSINGILTERKEDETEKTSTTLARVVGVAILNYGFLLMLLWLFDTQITNGPNLLTWATLGRLIAITDSLDAPMYGDDGKHYVTFTQLIFYVVGIWIFGAVVILLPYGTLWNVALSVIQKVFSYFSDLMFGWS